MKSSGFQAVINDEDRNVSNVYNTGHILITCDNETDIFMSRSTKDTIWNLEYTEMKIITWLLRKKLETELLSIT
jgi:hypothetical protein